MLNILDKNLQPNRRVGAVIFWLVTAMGPRIFDTDFLNSKSGKNKFYIFKEIFWR